MTPRLFLMLLVLVVASVLAGAYATAKVLGAWDAHTEYVIRVCWQEAPRGRAYRSLEYRAPVVAGPLDSLTREGR